jgi:CYTH domain-containing protein
VAGAEVERKWLVPELPAEVLEGPPADQIRQGYLTIGDDGAETRVRRRGSQCTLTVKSGRGMVRRETEITLSPEQFDALWPATEGARVEKARYARRAEDGHVIEVDVYGGVLGGLIVAEVEFSDPWGAESFIAPYWFGAEVTDDPQYKNQRLALCAEPPAPMSP